MLELIKEPWPWYVVGPLITLIMFLLLYSGGKFGVSSNLRTLCSIGGAGKLSEFFRFNWRGQIWNLVFILGAVLGGYLAHQFLMADQTVQISAQTVNDLEALGFEDPGGSYLPDRIFGMAQLTSVGGWMMLIVGGFLVGFGARYAGGCTSGHAISGISDLQVPSVLAVIGFFIGGLIMTHFLLPVIFG